MRVREQAVPRAKDENGIVGKMRKRWELTAAAVVVLAGLFSLINGFAHNRDQTLDFATFYTAGKIVSLGLSHHLYQLPVQKQIQHAFANAFLPFLHPPFEALLFAPLTVFSYPHALLVWDALNLLVWGLVAYRLRETGYRLTRFGKAVWWGLCAVFLLAILILGQDTLLLAAVFLLAFLALKQEREYAAGIWLGAGLFRFEVILPFVFIFLLRRRWKILVGFFGLSILAAGISVAMVGWGGLVDYAGLLLQAGQATGRDMHVVHVATMPSLRGLLFTLFGGIIPGRTLFPVVVATSVALLLWATWLFRSLAQPVKPTFDLEFSFATIAALLASYHVFVHELTPLMVVAFLLLGYEGARSRKGLLGNRQATALLFLFVAVFGFGWLVFHFHAFSVEALLLLALLAELARELAILRNPAALV